MHFFFMDSAAVAYDPRTPGERAIGGTQAAVAYLTAALARKGARVTLFNNATQEKLVDGVHVLPPSPAVGHLAQDADIFVVVGMPAGRQIRAGLNPRGPMVLWCHLAAEQPMMHPLQIAAEQGAWDRLVMVSQWHRDNFSEALKIDPAKMTVIGNAIAPFFSSIDPGPAWFETGAAPTLIYSSLPYRGLQVLLDIFPTIRASVPDARLKVFSGMSIYASHQGPDEYRFLYELARALPGSDYCGVVGQAKLAAEMIGAAALAYPATLPETACISLMEAMALGALPLTTPLGALAETAAGFGGQTPAGLSSFNLLYGFADLVIDALKNARANPARAAETRRKQIAFARETYSWDRRADEWIAFAKDLIGSRSPIKS